MAAIYDKALKRKDYSGIIDKDKQKEADQKKADANGHAAGKSIRSATFIVIVMWMFD